jgi:hypothetical protein
MSRYAVQICIVPGNWWDSNSPQPEFAQMVSEALAIERRLPKGVDVERERARHAICVRRAEQIVRSVCQIPRESSDFSRIIQAGKSVVGGLDFRYLAILDKIEAEIHDNPVWHEYRIGANIFPPGDESNSFTLAHHIRGFEHLALSMKLEQDPEVIRRLNLLRWANQQKCGIVELIDIYSLEKQQSSTHVVQAQERFSLEELVTKKSSGDTWFSLDIDRQFDGQQQRSQRKVMAAEVERALKIDTAVNINNYSHLVITDVLRNFVFTQNSLSTQYLKVVYEDGSQGRPFPVMCLPLPGIETTQRFSMARPLRVALLSIRHMEMDREVDMAWFRNTEASLRRSCYADTDSFCYQETLRQLEMLKSGEQILIHLYQTGLEPSVVGFFRALVEYLLVKGPQKAQVAVVPRYFRGLGFEYRSGAMWA